jgi:hypothetical protein
MKNKFSLSIVITLVLSIIPLVLHSSIAEVPEDIHIKSTNLHDNVVGHALGWSPDGQRTFFDINDETVKFDVSTILVNVDQGYYNVNTHALCQATYIDNDGFTIVCDIPPPDGSALFYTVFNQKEKVITESLYGPYPIDNALNNTSSPFILESSKDRHQNTTDALNNTSSPSLENPANIDF